MGQSVWFWNAISKNYAKAPIANEEAYQTKVAKTQGYFSPDMDVLEIGCGTGSTALLHAPHVNSYLATDFSDKMLGIGRAKAKKAKVGNLEFLKRDIDALGFEPESFDAVLAMSILHLLPKHRDVVGELFTILKPGGYLISSTACMDELTGMMSFFGNYLVPALSKIGAMPPVQRFTKSYLEEVIRDAGFELEEVWQPGLQEAVFIVARKPE